MRMVDRRHWLAGAGALALVPAAAAAAEAASLYDYLFLDLEGPAGTPPSRAYAEQVRARAAELATAGGEVLGLFTPQLGWVARQAALLVRWKPDARGRDGQLTALMRGDAVRFGQRAKLAPTLRPAAGDRPQPGGVYVHRWFTVEQKDIAEFLELSQQGWRDFETRFEARIFGLFQADRSNQDRADRITRLLLITRYRDHGVWEASRDPSTEAMAAFRRRQLLTRDTWAASTVLTPL